MSQEDVHNFVKKLRGLSHKIFNLPIPVIAALDGVALGKYHYTNKLRVPYSAHNTYWYSGNSLIP